MKHYRRIFVFVLAGVLLLACAACGATEPDDDPEPSTTQVEEQIPPLTPIFLPLGAGREALKPLIWGSEGWWLDTQGDYIFAHFFRYLLRYDARTNKIDKVIDLGDAPQSWWYAATYSSDGQSCVAQAQEFDGPGHTGRVIIDLANETVAVTEQEHYPHSTQNNPCQVEARLLENGYGWFINNVEIKALRPYAGMITETIAMDGNRVGALMPVSAEANGYLGYYKFAVIDLEQDKIVQECPMNILAPGEEYPTYPPEPETTMASAEPTNTSVSPSKTRPAIAMTREAEQNGLVLKVFTGYQHQYQGTAVFTWYTGTGWEPGEAKELKVEFPVILV